jgi:acyl-CoA reductase-like NAD-dependent aldehyde dehydrogenase
MLSREHGKTIDDAKGDIVRGLEVCEFVIGIPHLQKSEFTEGAGPGIDMYSIRQPVGVAAGITPFFVCATVGTTASNAIDPLRAIEVYGEQVLPRPGPSRCPRNHTRCPGAL